MEKIGELASCVLKNNNNGIEDVMFQIVLEMPLESATKDKLIKLINLVEKS